MKELSKCHRAPVTIGGDFGEGTHYYVCSECGEACDLASEQLTPAKASSEGNPLDETTLEKRVSKWFGEPVISVEKEVEAYAKRLVLSELERLKYTIDNTRRDMGQPEDLTSDMAIKLRLLKLTAELDKA